MRACARACVRACARVQTKRRIAIIQTMFALHDEQILSYRRLFHAMDADGGGSLDIDELRTALAYPTRPRERAHTHTHARARRYIFPDQSDQELQDFIDRIDTDGECTKHARAYTHANRTHARAHTHTHTAKPSAKPPAYRVK